jgi:hypothetical protein
MSNNSIVSTILAMSFASAVSAGISLPPLSPYGMQGLYAKNYLLAADGSAATGVGTGYSNEFYSVMDVYVKFNSAVGTGSNGERIVSFFGQATTDAGTYGVDKSSKYVNSANLAFQQSNGSWLPGASANGGAGNNTWDSFVAVGGRTQGVGNTGAITANSYWLNPNTPNTMEGGSSSGKYVGPGWYQSAPTEAAFETNASANADKMVMIGRWTLKCSDIVANGSPVKMTVWGNTTGKSTAQTGGTTMYTLASLNLKSDAQTKYTTGGKVWTFNSTFDGANVGQEAWTFATAVPTPGACVFLGLAGIFARRRRTNLTRTEIKHAVQNNIAMRFEAHMDMS